MSCVTYLPFLHIHCFELNSTLPCPSLLHSNSLPLPSIDPLHASLSAPVRLSLPVSNPTLIYLNSRYIILTRNILYSFYTPTQTHTPFPPPHTHTRTHTHTHTPHHTTHTHSPNTYTLFFTERRARLSLTTVSKRSSWGSP
jgi:hypothetical protein